MNEKTLAAIALSNRDYGDFGEKMAEAERWISFAAGAGADLVVLPEFLNIYRGDGPGHPNPMTLEEAALDDWPRQAGPLVAAAARLGVAVALGLLVRRGGQLSNSSFLISREGKLLGEYAKSFPTPGELEQGVVPGHNKLIEWEGLQVGGAICFDAMFPEVFARQAAAGADLFLMPSLSPGGSHLNFYAMYHATPIVLAYPAWSRIIDITGQDIAAAGYRSETLRFGYGAPVAMATINFDRESLYADINQARMVDVQKKYGRRVRVTFDQANMTFILESRAAEVSVRQIVEEFGLVRRRKFFAEARELVAKHGGEFGADGATRR